MEATLHFAVFAFSCAVLVASVSSLPPAVFKVGDERGWTVPANGTETYNHWAKRNRIQVGDVLSNKRTLGYLFIYSCTVPVASLSTFPI